MSVSLSDEPLELVTPRAGPDFRSWARFGIVLAFMLLGLAIAVAASRNEPAPKRLAFDYKPLKKIRRQKPDFVLIGNSMVYTRFSDRALNDALDPKRGMVLALGGSKSCVWYLLFKSYVVGSQQRFERVLFFFQERELTLPHLATTGRDAARLMRASREPDPVVEAKLAPPPSEPVNHLRSRIERWAPFERLHHHVEVPLDRQAVFVSSLFAREPDVEARMTAINGLFEMDALRAAPVSTLNEPTPHVFGEAVERSFLPDIIELAKANRIPLAFVRIRSRAHADGVPDPPDLTRYLADLRRYLEQNGAVYVDMKDAAWESADMYGNGSHLARRYIKTYTRMFAERVPQVFR